MYSQVSSFHCRYTGVLRIVQKRWHPWRFSSVVYSLVTHCTDRACKQTVWVVFTITHCTQKACKQSGLRSHHTLHTKGLQANNVCRAHCQRPYHVESTGSHLITDVKQRLAFSTLMGDCLGTLGADGNI